MLKVMEKTTENEPILFVVAVNIKLLPHRMDMLVKRQQLVSSVFLQVSFPGSQGKLWWLWN